MIRHAIATSVIAAGLGRIARNVERKIRSNDDRFGRFSGI
jgi:archaellum biogenesis protein FlaJ (TadC family)